MKHTEETKRKLSEMRKGKKNPFYGKTHTEEAKRKMALATRRRNLSTGQYNLAQQKVTIPKGGALAYFAGLIDADGSIRFVKEKGHLREFPYE